MTALAPLPSAMADRLAKFTGLLGSDADGERATAAAMATRLLRAHGWTWADLIRQATRPPAAAQHGQRSDPAAWRTDVLRCQRCPDVLTRWEADFLASIARQRDLTGRQRARLADIVAKVAEVNR